MIQGLFKEGDQHRDVVLFEQGHLVLPPLHAGDKPQGRLGVIVTHDTSSKMPVLAFIRSAMANNAARSRKRLRRSLATPGDSS